MTSELGSRVRTAHGDAWQAHGLLRRRWGGDAATVRGARLMASGLPHPQWNNADITGPDVDVPALHEWYAARRVPWGVRVPPDVMIDLGRPLFHKRCAALLSGGLRAGTTPPGVTIRSAGGDDLARFAITDAAVFSAGVDVTRAWIEPMLESPVCTLWLAESGGSPVGVANVICTDGLAGPAAYLAGVGVLPAWAGRGVEGALTVVAAETALAAGATLVHTNPEEGEMGRLAPLGFVEVPGFDVRIVVGREER